MALSILNGKFSLLKTNMNSAISQGNRKVARTLVFVYCDAILLVRSSPFGRQATGARPTLMF